MHNSQRRETLKYGRESRGTRNQEWLFWRRPAAIYPTRPTDRLGEDGYFGSAESMATFQIQAVKVIQPLGGGVDLKMKHNQE
jgi:hypothetical protein